MSLNKETSQHNLRNAFNFNLNTERDEVTEVVGMEKNHKDNHGAQASCLLILSFSRQDACAP